MKEIIKLILASVFGLVAVPARSFGYEVDEQLLSEAQAVLVESVSMMAMGLTLLLTNWDKVKSSVKKNTNVIMLCLLLPVAITSFTGCHNLTTYEQDSLRNFGKSLAKIAMLIAVDEISDNTKEVRPYSDTIRAIIETTFSQTNNPDEIGRLMKERLLQELSEERALEVSDALRKALEKVENENYTTAGNSYAQRISSNL